ncbi:MAG TPA: DNA-protecting protein DprA [Firmicutes bacterium]|nr:DNA-protecting protein DprA [Candidatus Fermentithermobacillaceae bacterium]
MTDIGNAAGYQRKIGLVARSLTSNPRKRSGCGLYERALVPEAKKEPLGPGSSVEDGLPGETDLLQAEKVLRHCEKNGISVLTMDDTEYPENLRNIPDPPQVLFVRGKMQLRDRIAVAVVGTRRPTPLGKAIALEFAKELARAGVTVVSGLAYGIDAGAHEGALSVGGRTLACLGTGPDVVYPRENASLFKRILDQGALISEYPPGTPPLPWHFPARNRLISGLALGVVVIEAGEKSGALITADWALKQGKPVMAVPGSIKSAKSTGTNRLIQDGAYLVTSARDVLSFLRRDNEYIPELRGEVLGEPLTLEEASLLKALEGEILTLDEITEKVGFMSPSRVLGVLSTLELKGVLTRLAGGKYVVKSASPDAGGKVGKSSD